MSRKHCGLPNYLRFYNGEVTRFFRPADGVSSNLQSLFVSSDDEIKGSYWNAYEKEQFFHLLARYLIHQADMIAQALSSKTQAEVLSYYHLLKRELSLAKKHQVDVCVAKVPVRLHLNQKAFIHKYKVHKKLKRLVLTKEIPIAFEMSDRFIEMEEIQALMLAETERRRNNDENQRFKTQLDTYKDPQFNDDIKGRALIDLDVASDISLTIWKKLKGKRRPASEVEQNIVSNNTEDEHGNLKLELSTRTPPKLHYKGLITLEMLIRAETKRIICKMMNDRLMKNWLLKEEVADVLEAIEFTRVDVERVMKQKYRLDIEEINKEKKELKKLKDKEIEAQNESSETLLDDESSSRQNSPEEYNIEFLLPEAEQEIGKKPTAISIAELASSQSNTDTINQTTLYNMIQETLHKEETKILEIQDMTESRNYEHVLLTSLTTFRENYEDVNSTMYDIDEAFEMLEEEDFDFDDNLEDNTEENDQEVVQVNQDMLDQFMNEYTTY